MNHTPSPVLKNQSPYEPLYGSPPEYSHLQLFGCACFVLLQSHEHNKLQSRSPLYFFLGYGIEHKGYRIQIYKFILEFILSLIYVSKVHFCRTLQF